MVIILQSAIDRGQNVLLEGQQMLRLLVTGENLMRLDILASARLRLTVSTKHVTVTICSCRPERVDICTA